MASSCHGEQHTGSAAVAAERRGSGGSSSGGSSSGSSSGGSSSEGPSLAAEECGGGFVDLLVRLLPAALVSCCHLRRESCVRCSVHVNQRRHWQYWSISTYVLQRLLWAAGRGAQPAMANLAREQNSILAILAPTQASRRVTGLGTCDALASRPTRPRSTALLQRRNRPPP